MTPSRWGDRPSGQVPRSRAELVSDNYVTAVGPNQKRAIGRAFEFRWATVLTEGGTCSSLERRQINRHEVADPIVSNDGLVSQPFDERPRDSRLHRRHDVEPQRGQVWRQDRTSKMKGRLTSQAAIRSIISRYVITSGPPTSYPEPSVASRPQTPARYATTSESAMG